METKNLLTLTITLVVGIILAGSLLMPVLNTYDEPTRTYLNEGVPYALIDSEDTTEHIIVIDADGVTCDGEIIDASTYLTGDYTLVFGEHSILRYSPSNGRVVFGGSSGPDTSSAFTDFRTASSEETLTITIVGDELTTVNGETTYTITDNWAYICTEGAYRYCVNPCVTATDRIIGGGVTYSPFSSATVICFDGTIEEITAKVARANPAATIDEVRVSTSPVSGNLVKIDAIYFDCTQSDTDKTATYTYFLAPEKITYNNPEYIGDSYAAILGALPILVIVALVMMAAGALYLKRED